METMLPRAVGTATPSVALALSLEEALSVLPSPTSAPRLVAMAMELSEGGAEREDGSRATTIGFRKLSVVKDALILLATKAIPPANAERALRQLAASRALLEDLIEILVDAAFCEISMRHLASAAVDAAMLATDHARPRWDHGGSVDSDSCCCLRHSSSACVEAASDCSYKVVHAVVQIMLRLDGEPPSTDRSRSTTADRAPT